MVFRSRLAKDLQIHTESSELLQLGNVNGPYTAQSHTDNESDREDEGERPLLASSLSRKHTNNPTEENTRSFVRRILLETVPTLFLTTVGLTFTGELLERVAHWQSTKRVKELYILIPMLNNLKGNLEMNLSSRLSTSANVGDLDERMKRRQLVLGNLSLLQVQALLVSAVAAMLSFLLGLIDSLVFKSESKSLPNLLVLVGRPLVKRDHSNPGLPEFCVLLSTSMASASVSGLIQGSFMCTLILTCRSWDCNPDNIASPIASCLGDLLTLCIVGVISSVLVHMIDSVMPFALLAMLILGVVFAIMVTLRNGYVRHLIFMGWTPLLGAMVISSGAGIVLDSFVDRYEGFGLLSIVLGGLPGAVGSVLISRLSTELHASASNTFNVGNKSARNRHTSATIMTLLLVTLPVQGLFLTFIHVMGWTHLPFLFVAIFVAMFFFSVLLSLVVAKILTQYLWRLDLDPDSYAMPIQSSVVDLLGHLMLLLCYEMAQALGADVKSKS